MSWTARASIRASCRLAVVILAAIACAISLPHAVANGSWDSVAPELKVTDSARELPERMVGGPTPSQVVATATRGNGSEPRGSGFYGPVSPGSVNASDFSTLTLNPSQHHRADAHLAWDASTSSSTGAGTDRPPGAQAGADGAQGVLTGSLEIKSSADTSELDSGTQEEPARESGMGEDADPSSAMSPAAPRQAVSSLNGADSHLTHRSRLAAGPENGAFSDRENDRDQETADDDVESSYGPQQETRTSDRSGGNTSWWPSSSPVPGVRSSTVLAAGTHGTPELASPWQWLPNKRGEGPASAFQSMSTALPLRPYSSYAPVAGPPAADAGLPWWATEAVQSVAAYTGKLPFPPEPMSVEGVALAPEGQEAGGLSHAAPRAPAPWRPGNDGPAAAGQQEGEADEDLGVEGISMIGELSSQDADAIIADEIQRLWPDQVKPAATVERLRGPTVSESRSVATSSPGPAISPQGPKSNNSGLVTPKPSADGREAANSAAMGSKGASTFAMSPAGVTYSVGGPQDANRANMEFDRRAAVPIGPLEQASEKVTWSGPGPAPEGPGGNESGGPADSPAVPEGGAPVAVALERHQHAKPGAGEANRRDTPALAPDDHSGQAAEAPAPRERRPRRRQRSRSPAPAPGEGPGPSMPVLTKEERAKAHAAEQAVKAAIQASRSNSTVAPKLPAVPVPPAISDMLMHIYPSLVMSRAAYEDPQGYQAETSFLEPGKARLVHITFPGPLPIYATDTWAYVVTYPKHPDMVSLVFRGSFNDNNFATDYDFQLVPYSLPYCGTFCFVHRGFQAAFDSITRATADPQTNLEAAMYVALQGREPRRILCTGHSLGGALATLCGPWAKALFPQADVLVHTAGSPRVGNAAFAAFYNRVISSNSIRLVLGMDPVPTWGDPGDGYVHVGHPAWMVRLPEGNYRIALQDRPATVNATNADDHIVRNYIAVVLSLWSGQQVTASPPEASTSPPLQVADTMSSPS